MYRQQRQRCHASGQCHQCVGQLQLNPKLQTRRHGGQPHRQRAGAGQQWANGRACCQCQQLHFPQWAAGRHGLQRHGTNPAQWADLLSQPRQRCHASRRCQQRVGDLRDDPGCYRWCLRQCQQCCRIDPADCQPVQCRQRWRSGWQRAVELELQRQQWRLKRKLCCRFGRHTQIQRERRHQRAGQCQWPGAQQQRRRRLAGGRQCGQLCVCHHPGARHTLCSDGKNPTRRDELHG